MKLHYRELVLVGLLLFTTASCERLSLSEEEAIRIIREATDLPDTTFLYLSGRNSPLNEEIQRLMGLGCMKEGNMGKVEPKGECANFVLRCDFGACNFYTHQDDILEISDILLDKSEGLAVVKYKIVSKPLPYFNTLMALDPEQVSQAAQRQRTIIREPRDKEITLKKWDQGWQVTNLGR